MQALHLGTWAFLSSYLYLEAQASLVVAHGLSCPVACVILVSQPGVELCPLHWKAEP